MRHILFHACMILVMNINYLNSHETLVESASTHRSNMRWHGGAWNNHV